MLAACCLLLVACCLLRQPLETCFTDNGHATIAVPKKKRGPNRSSGLSTDKERKKVFSATARGGAAGVAFEAGAVTHERQITAVRAGVTFVTLETCNFLV